MTTKAKTEVSDPLPTMEEFCLSVALYKPYTIARFGRETLWSFSTGEHKLDCYCMGCGSHSVFTTQVTNNPANSWTFKVDQPIVFARKFECSRVSTHEIYFVFRMHDDEIEKIGQSPSMADLSKADIRKYSAVLSKAEFNELSKAVGLVSYGIGIGAFVYLRRIFENLVEEAKTEAAKKSGWDEAKYLSSRMAEKILLLKDELPEFLVTNRKIYGILSSGVHSLDEKVCLGLFPVARNGIELMLEDKIAHKAKADKRKEVAKQLEEAQRLIDGLGEDDKN